MLRVFRMAAMLTCLRKWGSEQLNWDIHPIKALGPNAWLIGSKVHPPPGILTFNSKPVLLKHLPPKDATAPSPHCSRTEAFEK